MIKLKYPLTEGQPKRLEIDLRLRDLGASVRLDGEKIYQIKDQRTFKNGVGISLQDGSLLKMKLHGFNIEIDRDGKPIPGSMYDPNVTLDVVVFIFALLAIQYVASGLTLAVPHISIESYTPYGNSTAYVALVYAVMGLCILFKSKIIAVLSIVFCVIEGLVFLLLMNPATLSGVANILYIRCVIVICLLPFINQSKSEKLSK